ncbi:MAG: hypothetical protein JXR96_06775 [Deltaproteobacteria bacterium]|nr:hypothetical protein [Deltaproteobacteria bacterium]
MRDDLLRGGLLAFTAAWLAIGCASGSRSASRPAAGTEGQAGACRIDMSYGGRLELSVHTDSSVERIAGGQTRLTRDGDVLFGTLAGLQTRLRRADGGRSLSGELAGQHAMLTVERAGDGLTVRGPLGPDRLFAEAAPERIVLGPPGSQYVLAPVDGEQGLWRDELGWAGLRFEGCGPELLREQPELLVVLQGLICRGPPRLPTALAPASP